MSKKYALYKEIPGEKKKTVFNLSRTKVALYLHFV